ncbi:MAG: hypothetical protein IJO81_04365 [Clostridia bacterium]|nr:hypothetical protein [Clostridia bacterium]
MKFDKKALDSLLSLPDEQLVGMMRVISKGEFPSKRTDACTIAGLRHMLSQVTDGDISRACELIEQYKLGKKAGGRNNG